MSEYERFAEVYDQFMDEIPYENWCAGLTALLKKHHIEDGLVAELGCGTGTMTELLARAGYDMTGIDSSAEMLQQALMKRDESGLEILYLLQDMREFELYGTMRAIVAVCDTMNYLTDADDFITNLALVNNYLDPKGLFVFDLKTEHWYRDVLGDHTQAVSEEDAAYIWENNYDEETKINSYDLTIFEKGEDDRFDRFNEYHEQRAYSLNEIRTMAEAAGMDFVAAFDDYTENEARPDSERVLVVLRERGK